MIAGGNRVVKNKLSVLVRGEAAEGVAFEAQDLATSAKEFNATCVELKQGNMRLYVKDLEDKVIPYLDLGCVYGSGLVMMRACGEDSTFGMFASSVGIVLGLKAVNFAVHWAFEKVENFLDILAEYGIKEVDGNEEEEISEIDLTFYYDTIIIAPSITQKIGKYYSSKHTDFDNELERQCIFEHYHEHEPIEDSETGELTPVPPDLYLSTWVSNENKYHMDLPNGLEITALTLFQTLGTNFKSEYIDVDVNDNEVQCIQKYYNQNTEFLRTWSSIEDGGTFNMFSPSEFQIKSPYIEIKTENDNRSLMMDNKQITLNNASNYLSLNNNDGLLTKIFNYNMKLMDPQGFMVMRGDDNILFQAKCDDYNGAKITLGGSNTTNNTKFTLSEDDKNITLTANQVVVSGNDIMIKKDDNTSINIASDGNITIKQSNNIITIDSYGVNISHTLASDKAVESSILFDDSQVLIARTHRNDTSEDEKINSIRLSDDSIELQVSTQTDYITAELKVGEDTATTGLFVGGFKVLTTADLATNME
jgi:hypothetical protein